MRICYVFKFLNLVYVLSIFIEQNSTVCIFLLLNKRLQPVYSIKDYEYSILRGLFLFLILPALFNITFYIFFFEFRDDRFL